MVDNIAEEKYFSVPELIECCKNRLDLYFPPDEFRYNIMFGRPFVHQKVTNSGGIVMAKTCLQEVRTIEPFIKPNIFLVERFYTIHFNFFFFLRVLKSNFRDGIIIHEMLHIILNEFNGHNHSENFLNVEKENHPLSRWAGEYFSSNFKTFMRGNSQLVHDFNIFMRAMQGRWPDLTLRKIKYVKSDLGKKIAFFK